MQQREIEGTTERPELLVLGRAQPSKQVVMVCNNPHKLRATLARERRRKAIVVQSGIEEVRPGVWGARVVQLRPIRPGWVRPVVIAAAVTGVLSGLAALGWALVSLLVGVTAGLPVGGAVILAGVAAIGLYKIIAGKPGGGSSAVQVDVSVRVRR